MIDRLEKLRGEKSEIGELDFNYNMLSVLCKIIRGMDRKLHHPLSYYGQTFGSEFTPVD